MKNKRKNGRLINNIKILILLLFIIGMTLIVSYQVAYSRNYVLTPSPEPTMISTSVPTITPTPVLQPISPVIIILPLYETFCPIHRKESK